MNILNKTYLLPLMALAVINAFTGCSSSDDAAIGELEPNIWLYPYGSSSSDRAMQEAFYNQNKIYVLFNDTIRKEQVSVNPDGTPFYDFEAVDILYGMGNSTVRTEANNMTYTYLTTDNDKKAAVDFLSSKLLPSLGESLRPFSFLLVDGMQYYYDNYGSMVKATAQVWAGWRCTAVAMSGIGSKTDAEKEAFRLQLLKVIVSNKISTLDASLFDEFYSFCDGYYGTYKMYEAAMPFLEQYPTPESFGFIGPTAYYAWRTTGSVPMYNIAAKANDLADFTNALFAMSEAEFMATYADYPTVLKKYKILKKIITDIGVIL